MMRDNGINKEKKLKKILLILVNILIKIINLTKQ